MSNAQLPSLVDYRPVIFEVDSTVRKQPSDSPAVAYPSVLLVGRSGSWGKSILKSLARIGIDLSFAAPEAVNVEIAKARAYDLILLDSTVTAARRRELTSGLAGSNASVFYTFPVENGCWWLPALRRGEDCHGAPAFRRSEFPAELQRILDTHTRTA